LPHGCAATSLASTPAASTCARAASASGTTIWISCVPGVFSVMPSPITMEQAEPGGVSCTKRRPSCTL
jgi:hypothetical protein